MACDQAPEGWRRRAASPTGSWVCGSSMPSMLRCRGRATRWTREQGIRPHVHHPGHRRHRLRRQLAIPALLGRRPSGGRARPDAEPGERVLDRLPLSAAPAVEIRVGDVTGRPRSARRWPASMPSSTSSPSRATTTAARSCASSTPRGPAPWSWPCGRGRAAPRPHGRDGRQDDPDLHYASSKAKAEALVRASASTGRSSSRRSSSARATASSTSSRTSSGCRRARAGARRRQSRFQPIHAEDVALAVVGPGRPDHRRPGASSSVGRATGPTARSPPRS